MNKIGWSILVISFLILGILLGRYYPSRSVEPVSEVKTPKVSSSEPQVIIVTNEDIRAALKDGDPEIDFAGAREPRILKRVDLTGDGRPELWVDTGLGGAYTDGFALLGVKDGKLTTMNLREKDGSIDPADTFLSGASVRHGESAELLPDGRALYQASYEIADEMPIRLSTCVVNAYIWDASSSVFAWNMELSSTTQSSFCSDVTNRLNQG